MKNKIKKILTTSLISAVTLTTISATGNTQLLSRKVDDTKAYTSQSVSINESTNNSISTQQQRHKVGKIVETSSLSNDNLNTYTRSNGANYLADKPDTIEDNLISNSNSQTSLFVLSETPFITFSSDDNSSRFNMFIKFTRGENLKPADTTGTNNQTNTNISNETNATQNTSNELNYKRAILSIYTSELYNGNINLSEEVKTELENQLNNSSATTSNINSVISILENNLSSSSPYYGKNLNNLSLQTISSSSSSAYKDIADKIVKTFSLNDQSSTTTQSQNNQTSSTPSQSTTQNIQPIQNSNQTQTINQTGNINPINNSTISQNRNFQRYPTTNQSGYLNNQNSINSTTRRFGQNNNTQNQSTTTQSSQTENNFNNYQNNSRQARTMRADRTKNIDYISSSPKFNNSNRPRASRTPYTDSQVVR